MGKTIELSEKAVISPRKPKANTFRGRVARLGIKGIMLLAALYGTGAGAQRVEQWGAAKYEELKGQLLAKLRTTEVIREYADPAEHSTSELIRIMSREAGIAEIITDAIVEQESNYQNDSIRTEPALCSKLGAKEDKTVMLCSSHGLMQILGIEAKRQCKIDWSQLYDRKTNLRCGLTILKNNLAFVKARTEGERLRLALKMYNGRGEDAEIYADRVMSKIADRLISNNK